MTEFNYGDPHPRGINVRKRKYESDFCAARYYLEKLTEAERLYREGSNAAADGLDLFDQERHNIQRSQTWTVRHLGEDLRAAELCRNYPQAGASLLHFRLWGRDSVTWWDAAVRASRALGDRRTEADSRAALGLVLADLGDFKEAIESEERALRVFYELQDRRGTIRTLRLLGLVYIGLGDTATALSVYEAAERFDGEV